MSFTVMNTNNRRRGSVSSGTVRQIITSDDDTKDVRESRCNLRQARSTKCQSRS
jgi:hypothetical protein